MAPVAPPASIRLLLWVGFGGLLVLLIITGFSALSMLGEVQVRNQTIRTDYLKRARLLEQLRSDIYLSGTYVRDFLLETDSGKADGYRSDFLASRQRIQTAVDEYERILRPEETAAFHSLAQGLGQYFETLQPALQWTSVQRQTTGKSFMRDQLLTRRMTMINLANKVSQVNQRQLEQGNRLIQELFLQFRQRLLTLLALTLSVGLLVAGVTMHRMLSLERESAGRFLDVVKARREAQELSGKLVDVQEQERRRIARELHDQVGQSLSALLLGLGNLSKLLFAEERPEVKEQLGVIRTMAEKSVADVRNMSLLLRPSMLDDLGLIPALQWQAREISRATGMRVSVAAEDSAETLSDEYKTAIYRIVQEALHNCQKHSQAHRVRIQLQQGTGQLMLSVQDDGCGFEPVNRGLGLLGMEERVKRFGGRLQIDSQAGTGTLLMIELPRN